MKKQEYFREICKLLNIPIKNSFFSNKGSTITAIGLHSVYTKLTKDDLNFRVTSGSKPRFRYATKHRFMKRICLFLRIEPEEKWFSTGSTITTDAFEHVLEKLKKKIEYNNFDENSLPLTIDKDKNTIITYYDIINNPQLHFFKLNELSKKQLIKIVTKRIFKLPEENYFFLNGGSIKKEQAIKEIEDESEIGNKFLEIHKIAIDMIFEALHIH